MVSYDRQIVRTIQGVGAVVPLIHSTSTTVPAGVGRSRHQISYNYDVSFRASRHSE